MAATIALVLGFRSSNNLTGAYGVAIATTMVITTILAYALTRERWGWSFIATTLVSVGFLARNAAQAITFYDLPPESVFEVGIRIEL